MEFLAENMYDFPNILKMNFSTQAIIKKKMNHLCSFMIGLRRHLRHRKCTITYSVFRTDKVIVWGKKGKNLHNHSVTG